MAFHTGQGLNLVEQIGAARERELRWRARSSRLIATGIAALAAGFLLAALGMNQDHAVWVRWSSLLAAPAVAVMALLVGYYFGTRDAPQPVGADTVEAALRLYREASRMQVEAAREHELYLARRLELEAAVEARETA